MRSRNPALAYAKAEVIWTSQYSLFKPMREQMEELYHEFQDLRMRTAHDNLEHALPAPITVNTLGPSIFKLEETINETLAKIPKHLRYTATSSALAAKVFNIKELMELTLVKLDFYDLMSAQMVNRDMHATIVNSSTLQKKLFRTPDPDAHLTFNPEVSPCRLEIMSISSTAKTRPKYSMSFSITDLGRAGSLKVGASGACTLLFQPPPHSWEIIFIGCEPISGRGELTVAELVQYRSTPRVLMMAERLGTRTELMLYIKTEVTLQNDDPQLVGRPGCTI